MSGCCFGSTYDDENLLDSVDDVSEDNSQWMANLPVALTTFPITQLAIPGSHDSGAYYLDSKSPISPGKKKGYL